MQIDVNGIRFNVTLTGKPDGPTVVLSHSLGTSLSMWDEQMGALETDFRVLRYDTRGHGDSDAPEGAYTLEQLGDDAIGLLDAVGITGKVTWIGLSMGGMIGQNVVLNHPQRIDKLVLASTAAIMGDQLQPVWQERISRAQSSGMSSLAADILERWFSPGVLKADPPSVQRIRRQILATPVTGFIGCCEAIRHLDYLDRLSAIDRPTLIIVGEDDPGTPVAFSQAIHDRIAGSRLCIIPAVRHLCNIEKPEAFNNLLLEFLSDR
jgi:3-oxoadipate enol-lactonase